MIQIQKISSRQNQHLKKIRSVRERKEIGLLFIEGLRVSEELLKTNLRVEYVCFTPEFAQNPRGKQLIESLNAHKPHLLEVDEQIFSSISDTKNSQGIIAIAESPQTGMEIIKKNLSKTPILLLLHLLNNPANIGAIFRTAEAAGIEGIIVTTGSADVFSPKTLRSAMGANLRIPIWINANYTEALGWARNNKIFSICADIRSTESYLQTDWKKPKMLVIGSEGHGLTEEEVRQTDQSLQIPMKNNVESLNAAIACGIILFEAKRQREL